MFGFLHRKKKSALVSDMERPLADIDGGEGQRYGQTPSVAPQTFSHDPVFSQPISQPGSWSSFPQLEPGLQRAPEMAPPTSFGMGDRDLQLVLSKIEVVNARLEALGSRLENIERMMKGLQALAYQQTYQPQEHVQRVVLEPEDETQRVPQQQKRRFW